MKVILYQPQIPQNTGNIVRTCAVAGCDLILVEPLGFSITSRWLKRAGLDYWEGVNVSVIGSLEELLANAPVAFHLFSSKTRVPFTEHHYGKDDWLVFGSETAGLPVEVMQTYKANCVTIPMKSGVRCLNLATSVGIGVYEARRQQGFAFD